MGNLRSLEQRQERASKVRRSHYGRCRHELPQDVDLANDAVNEKIPKLVSVSSRDPNRARLWSGWGLKFKIDAKPLFATLKTTQAAVDEPRGNIGIHQDAAVGVEHPGCSVIQL